MCNDEDDEEDGSTRGLKRQFITIKKTKNVSFGESLSTICFFSQRVETDGGCWGREGEGEREDGNRGE